MADQQPRRRFTLDLADCGRPEDGCPYLRLRAALKRLLRSYAFRCTRVVEARPDVPGQGLDQDDQPDELAT